MIDFDEVNYTVSISAKEMLERTRLHERVTVQSIAEEIVQMIPEAIAKDEKHVSWCKCWLNYTKEQADELCKMFEEKGFTVTSSRYINVNSFGITVKWG